MATHLTHAYNKHTDTGRAPGKILGVDVFTEKGRDTALLEHARIMWDNLRDFRERRKRARRYHRGDQWGDIIQDPDSPGDSIREEDYILNQGRVPLKQNVIRQLFKNLMGQFVNNPTATMVYSRNREGGEIADMMGNAIRSVHDVNYMNKIGLAMFQEFALSGMVVAKQKYNYIPEKSIEDIEIDMPNVNRVFFNTDVSDPRLNDIRVIGELHDLPVMDIITSFAESEKDEKEIRKIYSVNYYYDYIETTKGLSAEIQDNLDFYIPHNPGIGRVIEVWAKSSEWRTYAHDEEDGTLKIIPETLQDVDYINAERVVKYAQMGVPAEQVPLIRAKRKYDHFWIVKYLTPYGHVLYEEETPYDHGEHPYSMVLYPGIDGEVWGLPEDIIDQQRYINRVFTLMDFISGSSAKGVLLVPEDAIPDDMHMDDFADEWTKVNGIIKYKAKPGMAPPQQISNHSVPVGLQEMLSAQLKLSYDIAGIHQAIQGQQAKSGTPASLYAQEAQNAMTNVRDFMASYLFFREKMDNKTMMLIRQFYQDKRWLVVNEPSHKHVTKMYDPDQIHDTMLDLKVTQGPDTPVYRQLIEDTLIALFQANAIDAEMLLEHSSLPYADKLLNSMRERKEQMQEGGIDQQLASDMGQASQQVGQGADPRAMEMLQKVMQ